VAITLKNAHTVVRDSMCILLVMNQESGRVKFALKTIII